MFSIVIPLYNKEQYISKCLKSVLFQTFQSFEIIIVNDGSTDNSLNIAEQINDNRILIINQSNSGASYARNVGVFNSNFEYVAFLDADDWWHPNYLEEMFNLILNYTSADLYGSNYYYVKNNNYRVEPKGLTHNFLMGYIDYISVFSSNFCVPINCSFVIVRKSAFLREKGFRSTLRFGEDFDLWIRLAINGKVAYLNKPLAYSNQDVDASSRSLGNHTLYSPQSHFVFNLDYLKPFENLSTSLKWLLDGLRVRSLLPYYTSGIYSQEVNLILAGIDFKNQPYFYRAIYSYPIVLIRTYFKVKRTGSILKQALLQVFR